MNLAVHFKNNLSKEKTTIVELYVDVDKKTCTVKTAGTLSNGKSKDMSWNEAVSMVRSLISLDLARTQDLEVW